MKSIQETLRRIGAFIRTKSSTTWTWYRARTRWQQIAIAALLAVLVIGGFALASSGDADTAAAQTRTVTLSSVGELSGTGSGTSIVGTVRSITEAQLLAQSGGTVRSVHTTLGATVPAGFVIADLDNASEAAAVLQAEGSYDAAIAARNITTLQSGGTQTSFAEAQRAARTTYRTAFTALDTTLQNDVDTFFGGPTAIGPALLINPGSSQDLPRKREALDDRMDAWRTRLAASDTQDPLVLLAQATADAQAISNFLVELSAASNARGARNTDGQIARTDAQLAGLATARNTVDAQLAALSAARDTYTTRSTAASVAGSAQSVSGTQLAAANANVKSALGSLRAAQANYEKTRVRATIGGTVNFLPIKKGQYVSAFEHVATVAQNGALEIVAYVSEDQRNALAAGMKVQVEGDHSGIITAVAPALDPTNKQIEVRVAVDATPDLVNGQSVRITLPNDILAAPAAATASSTANAPLLLPLTSVKLLPNSRAVFTVGEDGRIAAKVVTIGDVVGDRIQILSGLTSDMRIVTDVRGLSEGQRVTIGEAAGS